MEDVCDLDERLRQSMRTLRAWRWMARLSTNPAEIAELLTKEARDLIVIGRHYPDRARDIGKLIVAYNRMIRRMRMQHMADDAESVAG